jgi:hypothetical protein
MSVEQLTEQWTNDRSNSKASSKEALIHWSLAKRNDFHHEDDRTRHDSG